VEGLVGATPARLWSVALTVAANEEAGEKTHHHDHRDDCDDHTHPLGLFKGDRRAVGDDLGQVLGDFGGVEAHRDDALGAD